MGAAMVVLCGWARWCRCPTGQASLTSLDMRSVHCNRRCHNLSEVQCCSALGAPEMRLPAC